MFLLQCLKLLTGSGWWIKLNANRESTEACLIKTLQKRILESFLQMLFHLGLLMRIESKFSINYFSDYNSMGVFPIINRINHSCEPNCSVHWNLKTKREELFVMKSVEANTELTISYVDMISNASTRHERQEYLEKHFGFLCDCSLCQVSGEQLVHDNHIRAKVGVFFVTWWRNLVFFLSG